MVKKVMFLVCLISAEQVSASKSSSEGSADRELSVLAGLTRGGDWVLSPASKSDPLATLASSQPSAELDRHNDSKSGDATTPLNQQPPDFSEILNQTLIYMVAKGKAPRKRLRHDSDGSDLDGALSNVVRRLEV